MTDEYQNLIITSTQLPFVNDAVYNIILTELLSNAIAIARLEIGTE